MGRKRPHPSSPDGESTFPVAGKEKEPSEADLAYAHAVEVCNRLVQELEEQLKGSKYDGKQQDTDPGADR